MALLLGMSAGSLVLAGHAAYFGAGLAGSLVAAGSGVFFLGVFCVTMVFNVPRNNQLEKLNASEPSAFGLWQVYVSEWTFWNHVRTLSAFVAAACFSRCGKLSPSGGLTNLALPFPVSVVI